MILDHFLWIYQHDALDAEIMHLPMITMRVLSRRVRCRNQWDQILMHLPHLVAPYSFEA